MDTSKKTLIKEIDLSTNRDQRTVVKRNIHPFLRFLLLSLGSITFGVLLAVLVIKPLLKKFGEADVPENTMYEISAERVLEDRMIFYNNNNIIIVGNPIKINPTDSKGEMLLTVTIGFEFSSHTNIILNRFLNNELIIRDKIIDVISNYSSSQLLSPDIKINLLEQIKRNVSLIMNTDKLADLYFYDYYLSN